MTHLLRAVLLAGFLADTCLREPAPRPVAVCLTALVFAALAVTGRFAGCRVAGGDGKFLLGLPCAAIGVAMVAVGVVRSSCGLCMLGAIGISCLTLPRDVLWLAREFQAGTVLAALGLLAAQRLSLFPCSGPDLPFHALAGGKVVLAGQVVHVLFLPPFWGLAPLLFACLAGDGEGRRCRRLLSGAAVLLVARVAFVAAAASLGRQDAVLYGAVSLLELAAGSVLAFVLFRGNICGRSAAVCSGAGPLAGALGALLVAAVSWSGGCRGGGTGERVLIDESHGRWETVEAAFDTEGYGRHTVYNYRLMREWLQRRFQTVVCQEPLTNIAAAATVIIKTPVRMYTQAEKSALESFVRGGGRLLVIGDHTNLFGTTDVINDLLAWSGLRLGADAVIAARERHHDMPRRWWSFAPAVSGISRVEFQTGATVVSDSVFARPLFIANRTVAEAAEYTNDRFFGDLVPTLDDRPAPVCMAAVRRLGKGAVTLFSDSTVWSNFSFYAVTNEHLFEVLIGSRLPPPPWGAGLAVLAAVILAAALRRQDQGGFGKLSFRACAWDAAVAVSVMFLARETSPVDDARIPAAAENRVVVDARNSTMNLRADIRTGGRDDLEDYSTFYAWLSRSGLHPRCETGCAYGDPSLPVLLVDPGPGLGRRETGKILDYLAEGGRLLVLLEPDARSDYPAGDLLRRLGVELVPLRTSGAVCDAASPEGGGNPLALPFALLSRGRAEPRDQRMALGRLEYGLSGVTPLLVADTGVVMAGETGFGRGRLTVFARSKLFSEFFFGDVWGGSAPSPEKLQAYHFLGELVDYAFRP